MTGQRQRGENRKYKRVFIRFGMEAPEHRAVAMQISRRGLFISTNRPVYAPGSRILVEITTPDGARVVEAVVRHAKRVPPQLARAERPGMGVEFVSLASELGAYLDSL